jgi:hypothetical protein
MSDPMQKAMAELVEALDASAEEERADHLARVAARAKELEVQATELGVRPELFAAALIESAIKSFATATRRSLDVLKKKSLP